MRDEQPEEPRRAAYTDLEEDQDAAGMENGQGLGATSPLVTKIPMTSSPCSSTASMLASYSYFSSPPENGEKKREEADNGKDRERFRDVASKNEETMQRAAEEAVGKGGKSASECEGERMGEWQEIMESQRKGIAKPETDGKSRDLDLEREWEREAKDTKREEVDREDTDKDQHRQRQTDTPNREQDDVTARAAAELELVKEKERERRRREDQVAARCPLFTAIEICSPMPTNTHMFVCFPLFFFSPARTMSTMHTYDRFKAEAERAKQRAKAGASAASKNLASRASGDSVLREVGSPGTSVTRAGGNEIMGSTGSRREAEERPEGEAGRIVSGGEGEREAGQSRSSLEDEDAQRQRMLLQVLTNAASQTSAQSRSRSSGIGGGGGAGRYDTPMLSAQHDTPMPSPLMTSKHKSKSSVCLSDCVTVCLSVCLSIYLRFTCVW
jgi:hypothetical protein